MVHWMKESSSRLKSHFYKCFLNVFLFLSFFLSFYFLPYSCFPPFIFLPSLSFIPFFFPAFLPCDRSSIYLFFILSLLTFALRFFLLSFLFPFILPSLFGLVAFHYDLLLPMFPFNSILFSRLEKEKQQLTIEIDGLSTQLDSVSKAKVFHADKHKQMQA